MIRVGRSTLRRAADLERFEGERVDLASTPRARRWSGSFPASTVSPPTETSPRHAQLLCLPAQGQVELDGRSDRRVHENLGVCWEGDGDTRQLVHRRLRRDGDRRQLRDLHRSLADHVAAQTMQALIVGRDITGVGAFA